MSNDTEIHSARVQSKAEVSKQLFDIVNNLLERFFALSQLSQLSRYWEQYIATKRDESLELVSVEY